MDMLVTYMNFNVIITHDMFRNNLQTKMCRSKYFVCVQLPELL